eukprot:7377120-Prymnesium_polylepis.1
MISAKSAIEELQHPACETDCARRVVEQGCLHQNHAATANLECPGVIEHSTAETAAALGGQAVRSAIQSAFTQFEVAAID